MPEDHKNRIQKAKNAPYKIERRSTFYKVVKSFKVKIVLYFMESMHLIRREFDYEEDYNLFKIIFSKVS